MLSQFRFKSFFQEYFTLWYILLPLYSQDQTFGLYLILSPYILVALPSYVSILLLTLLPMYFGCFSLDFEM